MKFALNDRIKTELGEGTIIYAEMDDDDVCYECGRPQEGAKLKPVYRIKFDNAEELSRKQFQQAGSIRPTFFPTNYWNLEVAEEDLIKI